MLRKSKYNYAFNGELFYVKSLMIRSPRNGIPLALSDDKEEFLFNLHEFSHACIKCHDFSDGGLSPPTGTVANLMSSPLAKPVGMNLHSRWMIEM